MKNKIALIGAIAVLSLLGACGQTASSTVASTTNSSAAQCSVLSSAAPFVVGTDSVVATTEGASQYAPTFTVNVSIIGGKSEVYFSGTVKLTSDTMWASEFTTEAIADKGLAQDGVATGFVNTIGDYTGGAVGELYYYWSFSVNNVYASFGCNKYQMRDGDYLAWSFVSYKS